MSDLSSPPDLIHFSLSRAIQLHSEDFRVKNPQVRLDLDLVEDANLLPTDSCTALYRVYLAGLASITSGEQACSAYVRYYPARDGMALEIHADGPGFSAFDPAAWAGVQETIKAFGGQVEVLNQPGKVQKLRAWLPFPKKAAHTEDK